MGERERGGDRGGEREGLGQGGMREETRQIVSLGQERKEGKREVLNRRRSENSGSGGSLDD